MTRLDAVNQCLRARALDRVNSLTAGDPTTATAESVVDDITYTVQTSGWSCNTDYEVELALDGDSRVPVPANALVVTAKRYNPSLSRVSVRVDPANGLSYLWDVRRRTWTFSRTVKVDIIYNLPFDELDGSLQSYIAARAARTFAADSMGADAVDKRLLRHEQEAYIALIDEEATAEDLNILTDNAHCRMIVYRNNDFFGR